LTLTHNSIITSRNIVWLNKTYGQYKNLNTAYDPIAEETVENSEDEEIMEIIPENNHNGGQIQELDQPEDNQNQGQEENNQDQEEAQELHDIEPMEPEGQPDQAINQQVSREIRNLTTSYNPFPSGIPREVRNLTTSYNPTPDLAELAMLAKGFNNPETILTTSIDGFPSTDPQTYKQVKASKNWGDWWKAMSTEFKNMEEKKVWTICKKNTVPRDRKIIGNRWVFAIKDDGRFRARTVAKGFSQIPGQDFQENHAPVVNDTTFHLVLALKLLFNLEAGQFDIETAFLYGDLDEELWMVFPDGYEDYLWETHKQKLNTENHCVKLEKAIYGLVQAARQWWQKFKCAMTNMHFKPSSADPCLFIKETKNKKDASFVIIYVDDGIILGTEETIQGIINELSKSFKVKVLGPLEHYVGCHIIENKEKDTIWIHQPKLLKHLEESFGHFITTTRNFATPAGPKTTIIRPQMGDPLITAEEQTTFRSGVGMLLYLVKHSRPDIANAVRELSKVADGATQGHWKSLIRLIKYVLDTYSYGLKMKPKRKGDLFFLEGISDSEYAGDKDNRISVYGYILYFCGAPIAWKSKAGKSVTLSSTEAEYFAASKITKEIMFTKQVIESMGLELEYPMIVKVDNVGAIYLANNHSTSQRTKHIDIRTHFVREFIEEGILKIVFVKSANNDADILTKNTTEEIFLKHQEKVVENVFEHLIRRK